MENGTVLFSHGQESSPSSRKIVELAPIAEAAGFFVEAIDYQDLPDDPVGRRDRLLERIDASAGPIVLVGSSLGGWVSMSAAERREVAGLWLMAPALFLEDRVEGGVVPEAYRPRARNVVVVHGWGDDIITWRNAMRFAEAAEAQFHLVDDGHRLESSIGLMQHLFADFLDRVARA
ncbi:MAG: alpha/beta hydrolase [Candidatus Wenzhouxiangella sp. M2_3B_020]